MNKLEYLQRATGYILNRFVLARKYLTAHSRKYGVKMKFKTQDGGGRMIYKNSNTGRHSLLNINTDSAIEVETVALDDFIDKEGLNSSKIKLLKMDIEGYEYKAFLGGKKLLSSVPYILAEFSPGYMRKGGLDPAEVLRLLRAHQFVPHIIKNQTKVPVEETTLLNSNANANILWEKQYQKR
ncbi:MAG: FkbM family methyltransferase [bacterium]